MKKIFSHVAVNVVLLALVLCVSAVGTYGGVLAVFRTDYAPVYGGSGDGVCFLVNVYWGTEYIDGFLEIFQKYGVYSTFFVGGVWAAENPDVLKKICDSGQEIGNHGFYHKMHGSLSYRQNAEEILTCSKLIFEICGVFPTLFAPPSGDFCQDTLKAAYDNGFTTVMWSRDTIDWRDRDSSLVLKRATQGTQKGEFILMHPTAHTLAVLEEIVQYYLKKDMRPVTVGEMLERI